jgi:dihydrofolate synthase/folylpolyglutamate synthase
MGGKWDSTNVADGDIAVFTPIGFDHQQWLGDNLFDIAATKSGIIKPNATVIRSVQEPEVADILDQKANDENARVLRESQELFVVDRQFAVGGQVLTLQTPAATYEGLFLPLHGKHQAHNALLALAAVETLLGGRKALDPELVAEGFATVSSPGRLELVKDSPTILVDVAHNPHGARALCEALSEAFNFNNLIGVVGMMADKDVDGFLSEIEPQLDKIILTKNSSARCADPSDIYGTAVEIFGEDRVIVQPNLPEALAEAVELAEAADATGMGTGAGVLVTGSVVTVADARKLLGRR